MKELTTSMFKELIFDFENDKKHNYIGTKPCIIDFYSTWCSPCKQLSFVLDTVEKEYGDKIEFYKVNTEVETDIIDLFEIRSIPTLVYVPMKGDFCTTTGLIPKTKIIDIINDVLI